MKITIRNLGVLTEEAHIDLKPLTVLIGPNNAGKTWLAYTLAGILGPFGSIEYAQAYADKKVPDIYEPLESAIKRVFTKGNAVIDLHRFADEYGERYFNDIAQYIRSRMNRFFCTQLAHFETMDVSLSLGETKTDFLDRITMYSPRPVRVAKGVGALTIRKNRYDNKVSVVTATGVEGIEDAEEREEQLEEGISSQEIRERLISFVSTALRRSLYTQVRVFPTERTFLVTARFSRRLLAPERMQLSKINERLIETLDALVKEELGGIRALADSMPVARELSDPVGSFLGMLNAIFSKRSEDIKAREEQTRKDPRIRKYIELAEILEDQILEGGVSLSTPEPDPRREVLFQPAAHVNLEIPIVSSMVKELSPLVLYLRHLAMPGELVIIDEPEMNLHPAAQVKIIEFLAMLVNAGLHVLITTHSTYMIDHLSNLMEAAKHANQDEIVEKFLLEQKESFIPQDKVSVYLVEKGKVKNALDPAGVIDWRTFSDVTRLVDRIHFELLEG